MMNNDFFFNQLNFIMHLESDKRCQVTRIYHVSLGWYSEYLSRYSLALSNIPVLRASCTAKTEDDSSNSPGSRYRLCISPEIVSGGGKIFRFVCNCLCSK